jgi:hypothetical protein
MNLTQVIFLMVGLVFAGLCLILILAPFNLYYYYETPTGGVTVHEISCPAPVDSCDKGDTPLALAICEECDNYAGNRWIWFGVWQAMILIGAGSGIFLARTRRDTGDTSSG